MDHLIGPVGRWRAYEHVPVCAVCNKPVERFYFERADDADTYIYIAECHGDREVVTLGREVLVTANFITLGKAFDRKGLPDGQKKLP